MNGMACLEHCLYKWWTIEVTDHQLTMKTGVSKDDTTWSRSDLFLLNQALNSENGEAANHVVIWGEAIPDKVQFSSVQLLSHVRLLATPWISAHQDCLSITNSRSSLKLTSIESVMPSSHLILCRLLLLLPPIPPTIRVFSNESTLRMRWPCVNARKMT